MPQKSNIVRISKKGSNTLLTIFLVLLFVFIIGIGHFLSKGDKKEENKSIGGPESNELNTQITNESKKEEKKEKSKKEEKKEEKKQEIQKTISYEGSYFSVNYPENWQTKKINGTTVGFFSPDKKTGNGEITMSYKENKKNLPIERFYDGVNDVNLFEDAMSGFKKTTASGFEAYQFKDLVGETNSAVLVIKASKGFLEISDNYNAHQNDGIFDEFIKSVKVK